MTRKHVELTGDDEFKKFLAKSPELAKKLLAKAMYEEASEGFGQSQDLVPVRYGVLRASGSVTEPEFSGNMATINISYGGAAAPYAAYVHEVDHYKHDEPTRSKYLSYPLERRFPVLGSRLRVRLENMLKQAMGK